MYDRLGRQAFGLAFRILEDGQAAEDVVQEAFLTIWRRSATLDPAKGKVASLLMTIVHRRSIDALRARKGLSALPEGFEPPGTDERSADPAEIVDVSVRRSRVRNAMESLPQEQREVIELAYFKGMTHVEISESTNIPLGTVKSRMRLGLKRMKTSLAELQE